MTASSHPPPTLRGRVIESEVQPGVRYQLERHVGEGGMGMAYLAWREAPDGVQPVVVKVVTPGAYGDQVSPELVAQKEAVALGRLNECVPACPFVVRFVDTGSTQLFGRRPTPWIAIEYVHGGVEGTTLDDRLMYSIHKTGFAFDARRVAHALRCLSAGLSAIHGVGVIHRDLTPGNVLCCGFGETEIFKISDFGLARPHGLGRTFAGMGLGTPGFAAPEQIVQGSSALGFQTDVFALAAILFTMLTNEALFEGDSPLIVYEMTRGRERRSIMSSSNLSPELRERPDACRAIDAAIARATALEPELRPASAEEFAATVLPWLTDQIGAPRSSRRLMSSMLSLSAPADLAGFEWKIRHRPREDMVVQSAAWDTDGHCFAFTPRGPFFWSGEAWLGAKSALRDLPRGMTFTRRYEAGGWLVGGSNGTLAVCTTAGVRDLVLYPDSAVEFLDANGRFDDLITAVGRKPGQPPWLIAMSSRRWMKPLVLEGVQNVSGLLRLDDARWVVCGRLLDGNGFAAIYAPMQWELTPLMVPQTRAFVGGSSNVEREFSLVVGSSGVVLRIERDQCNISVVQGAPDLSAGAVDLLDREWVASLSTLWTRDPRTGQDYMPAWKDPGFQAPFISLIADAGLILAMSADGGIVEGRRAVAAERVEVALSRRSR
ncbi:MAG TPA: serine/threonine-protein kinase [Polyangiaceae bacterium]|nr:serine/threonine-protein kinase [Polyangiaceae bacterium]